MSDWYYSLDNQQRGPVNESELVQMLTSGKLLLTTLVWKDGMAGWVSANTLPEFQFRPPPLPSAPKASTPPPLESVTTAAADPVTFTPEDVEANKVMGILAYISLLFLVPLIVAKDSPFAKYHTNQGLVLFLASFVASIGLSIVTTILGFIPFLGLLIAIIAWPLFLLAWLVFVVIGMMNASKGEAKPLPYIGQYKILN